MKMRFRVALFFLACFAAAPAVQAADTRASIVAAQQNMAMADLEGGIQRLLGPGAAVPKIGPNASVLQYVRWAKSSLDRGQEAEAELSLEWGQARRRVDEEENALAANAPPPPYDSLCNRSICQAMRAIGFGDPKAGRVFIVKAIAEFYKEDNVDADYADPADGKPAGSIALGIRENWKRVNEAQALPNKGLDKPVATNAAGLGDRVANAFRRIRFAG